MTILVPGSSASSLSPSEKKVLQPGRLCWTCIHCWTEHAPWNTNCEVRCWAFIGSQACTELLLSAGQSRHAILTKASRTTSERPAGYHHMQALENNRRIQAQNNAPPDFPAFRAATASTSRSWRTATTSTTRASSTRCGERQGLYQYCRVTWQGAGMLHRRLRSPWHLTPAANHLACTDPADT